MRQSSEIHENHPVRVLFRKLTDRALSQSSLSDKDILFYLTELLLEFMYVDNLYKLKDEDGRPLMYLTDMLQQASDVPRHEKQVYYRHIGDFSLFMLGMFPESLSYGRRCIPHSFYADTGRSSYLMAGSLQRHDEDVVVFRKLADRFERCVLSLNWFRQYTSDPFYQYILRQFGDS